MMLFYRGLVAAAVLAFGVTTLSSCSGGKASAHGQVTYNGKTIKSGSLVFTGPDGVAVLGAITDGRYSVEGVAPGVVKVGVSSPNPNGAATGGRAAAGRDKAGAGRGAAAQPAASPKSTDSDWFPIPDLLGSPETSGFQTRLRAGDSEVNLDFK